MKSRLKYYNRWKKKAKNVKVLFIAESPPKDKSKYFYFEDTEIKGSSLSAHLFRALKIDKKDKETALEDFISKKYFLMDAIDDPIFENGKLKSKKKQISNNLEHINKEIDKLRPKKIIVIGKCVYDILSKQLDVKLDFVYFPTHWKIKGKEKTGTELFYEELKEKI